MIKFQDLIFFLTFLPVAWRGRFKLAVGAGLACLLLAIPMFQFKILFTAERLTWYAAAFFFLTVLKSFGSIR